ncbi:MAG: hypothetical protein RLZZ299_1425, partial [Pseudomonadota bacterium]
MAPRDDEDRGGALRGGGHAPAPPQDPVVVDLPADVPVLDLSSGPRADVGPWWIGRYDEDRRGGYPQAIFGGVRTLHVGLDLGAPAGTPVHAFADGVVEHAGVNPASGDYGGVVVTRHALPEGVRWVLWGHLAHADARRWRPGDVVRRGEVLARLGTPEENGGWPPHLHLQLAVERPDTHDMPGVVDPAEREAALRRWPDPVDLL